MKQKYILKNGINNRKKFIPKLQFAEKRDSDT